MSRFNPINKTDNDELEERFDYNEYQALEQELTDYLVKFPDEDDINATIDTMRQYVPAQTTKSANGIERLITLCKGSATEVTIVSKIYWITCTMLFIIGYLITHQANANPLLTLIFLAPLPFVIGLLEVFKGREHGLLEIELTCKFTTDQIMLSRLFLIGITNVTLNTVLTLTISPVTGKPILEILLTWLTPFTFFIAIALWLSIKFKGQVFVTTFLSLWLVFIGLTISNNHWIEALLNINIVIHLICLGFGSLLISFQVKQLINKYQTYEGGQRVEINY
ncbi:hypothetical protein [Amphibacillus cookii]|uniref:hypothetical protein n=1 Tax=Amphibacillus cookii TaxID=767787 RepID=UPI001958C233|nr:hypothetical protein [Amphibacillus cookii]MBM7541645.1 putative membrane protein [Amphibacillus cookii]